MSRALVAAACVLLAGCATEIQSGAVIRATDNLSESDYPGALDRINSVARPGYGEPDALNEAYLVKAQALEGLGRKGEAVEIYKSLIASDSSSAAAHQARGRLLDLGEPCAPSPH